MIFQNLRPRNNVKTLIDFISQKLFLKPLLIVLSIVWSHFFSRFINCTGRQIYNRHLSVAGSRTRIPNRRWTTTRRSSARLWRKPSVANACPPGRRSRCWWAGRRCCARCTTPDPAAASSTSALIPPPMRFAFFFLCIERLNSSSTDLPHMEKNPQKTKATDKYNFYFCER